MKANAVKKFFLFVLIMTILGALSSCSSRSNRETLRNVFSVEQMKALESAGVFKETDTTLLFSPMIGEDSTRYKGRVYVYNKVENKYLIVNY